MLNDRKDKYEGQPPEEEGEYHFTEDEVSYDVESETETSKKTSAQGNFKETILNRITESKRLIIGVVAFLVLIFVVYKFVSPPSAPVTDITPQAPAQPQPMVATAPTNQPRPAAPVNNVLQAPVNAPQQQSMLQQPTQALSPMQQPVAPTAVGQPTTGVPVVIPVQPAAPVYPGNETASPELRLAANNEKLITQMQAEYTQKMNDLAGQNKLLQDQLQLLNTRVATMEAQMNQLMQTLTRQTSGTANQPANQPAPSAPEVKIPYSVQAIIPGRAWLRSDNGETVTVAEGDMVKGVGRVSKIDPYDGVVEINTGTKVISLSYGAGN